MAYIFNKFLDRKKKVHYSLRNIYGLGSFVSLLLCNKSQIGIDCKIQDLSQNQLIHICKNIDEMKLLVEHQLKSNIRLDISRLISIRCFRSFLHKRLNHVEKK